MSIQTKQLKPLILVIDDEPRFRYALQACLEPKYEVCLAIDGVDALEKAKKRLPDLIVLDLSMPKMGGKEFKRALNEIFGTATPPTIVMTAHADADSVGIMAALGAKSYMLKPFDIDCLEKRIEELLDPDYSETALARIRTARASASTLPPHEALAHVIKILEADPFQSELRLIVAQLYLMLGENKDARYNAQVACAASPSLPQAQLLLAYCEMALSHLIAAHFHSRRAITLIQEKMESK